MSAARRAAPGFEADSRTIAAGSPRLLPPPPPRPTVRRGLVIGAGAALGGAWALDVLHALTDVQGFDPRAVDVVVGTSAGSIVAALIGCGVAPGVMVRLPWGRPTGPEQGGPAGPPPVLDSVQRALTRIPWPLPFPGNPLLAARVLTRLDWHAVMTAAAALAPRGRGDLAPIGELVQRYCDGGHRPTQPQTWVVATDFDSGRRVVFGRPGAPDVPLAGAVVASCSAPAYFPPTRIAGRRYVDGAAVSFTNADLLLPERLDEIVVLAPMAMSEPDHPRSLAARLERTLRRCVSRRVEDEVRRLAATGAFVRVFAPTAEDLAGMGANLMNPRDCRSVFATAVRTTSQLLLASGPAPNRPVRRSA